MAEGRLQGTPPARVGQALSDLPPAFRAAMLAEKGPWRMTGLGRGLAAGHLAFWLVVALLGEVLRFDPVPTVGWLLVALVPTVLFHGLVQRMVPGARTRLPEDLGSMAPVGALDGLVQEPADPLLRAVAAQPWLLWAPPHRSVNLELPLLVLARAEERVAGVKARLDELDGELRAGEHLLGELGELAGGGAAGADGAAPHEERASEARTALGQRRDRARHLRKVARALAGELRRAAVRLKDAVERPEPPEGEADALKLSVDLGPLLQRAEAVIAEARQLQEGTATSSSRSSRL